MSKSTEQSRREFLKTAGAGAATVIAGTIWPVSLAAAPKQDGPRFRIVHYTDVHVQPEQNGERGFAQAIEHMNGQKAAFAISGGDLVFETLKANAGRARRLWDMYTARLRDFDMPAYQVMGNHDKFGLLNKDIKPSEPGYGEKMFLERLGRSSTYTSFDHGRWRFVLLDSIFPEKGGGWNPKLDEKQMAWLESELKAAEGRPVCAALHVPVITSFTQMLEGPLAAPRPQSTMHDAKELRELFEASNVKLVLQGHVHIREHYEYNGVHYISGGAVSGAWWEGPRNGHPEGYATIDFDGDGFTWNYHTYGWKAKKRTAYDSRDRAAHASLWNERAVFALIDETPSAGGPAGRSSVQI
jgi:3',5'-cyclic AMP phosphodiesterase CpdA